MKITSELIDDILENEMQDNIYDSSPYRQESIDVREAISESNGIHSIVYWVKDIVQKEVKPGEDKVATAIVTSFSAGVSVGLRLAARLNSAAAKEDSSASS